MDGSISISGGGGALRVFLVEDSDLVRARLHELLEGIAGACMVGEAASAEDAIAQILASAPDLVVLDVKLSGGSGFDVLRALNDRAPAIDVYMLSNLSSEPYRRLATRLGAREFFDKSTELERVRVAIGARAALPH